LVGWLLEQPYNWDDETKNKHVDEKFKIWKDKSKIKYELDKSF
jgi:hypothetical protein